jgi:hypothetical protein
MTPAIPSSLIRIIDMPPYLLAADAVGQEGTLQTLTRREETKIVVTDTEPVAGADPCPLTAALNVIGGKWNLIVLYWLATRTTVSPTCGA